MKLLANENFPLTCARHLEAAGFDVKHIGVSFSGITDQEVMNLAIEEDRLILTFDRDYGELIFKIGYRPQAGVIYMRFQEFSFVFLSEFLINLLNSKEYVFEGAFTVVDADSIRQRRYI